MAKVHFGLSNLDLLKPDLEAARGHLEIALDVARRAGDEFQTGWSLFLSGGLEQRDGNWGAASPLFRESLRVFAGVEDVTGILFNLEGLAVSALHEGRVERGVKLGAGAEILRAESGTGLTDPAEVERFNEFVKDIDQAVLARVRAEAASMSRDELIAYALEE